MSKKKVETTVVPRDKMLLSEDERTMLLALANRLALQGTDKLQYDATSARWRFIN